MKAFKHIVAWALLAILSVSVIPMESFHHHEEHSFVCTDSNTHIEEQAFECELADFVLPVFTDNDASFKFESTSLEDDLLILENNSRLDLRLETFNSRGPPSNFLLG